MHNESRSIGATSKKKSTRKQKGTQTTALSIDQGIHDVTALRDPAPPPNRKRKQNQGEAQTTAADIGLDEQDSAITNQVAQGPPAATDSEQAQLEESNSPDRSDNPEVERRMYCNVCLRTVERLGEAVSKSTSKLLKTADN